MAYLLGNQSCMESLQSDVLDLQQTVGHIISRVGPINVQSWKFPDKSAWDIDIDDLLDLYDCSGDSDDAEERQVAHIALYELVIDRMVLLLQVLSKFCTVSLGSSQMTKKNKPDGHSNLASSIGLVVKEHWTEMVSAYTVHQQMMSENTSKSNQIIQLEKASKNDASTSDTDPNRAAVANSNRTSPQLTTPGTLGLIPPNTADLVLMGYNPDSAVKSDSHPISKDTNAKSCQTYESAFVPCESCDVVQRKMREAGDVVIKVCSDQSLPCSLKKFKSQVMHVSYLSFNDVCRWMGEQNKDIARIGKQIEILQGVIEPMKSDVKKCENRTRAAEGKAKQCEKNMKEEKENQAILRKHIEKKMKEQESQHQELLDEEERQKGHLKRCKDKLELEVKEVTQELDQQHKKLSQLKAEHKKIKAELEEKQQVEEKAAKLEKQVVDLKVKVADLSTQVDGQDKTLVVEQSKNRSVSKHNESLQAKQTGLLSRMEALGQENEELSQQVATLEEERVTMEDKVTEMKVETKQLRKKAKESEIIIKNLETEKSTLEQKIQKTQESIDKLEQDLKEAQERERLIIEYPDLNGPVNPDIQGTGDIVEDMRNQVTANCIRIKVLDSQNQSLNESVRKVVSMQQTTRPPIEQVPLWRPDAVYLGSHGTGIDDQKSTREFAREEPTHTHQPEPPSSGRPPKVQQHAWTFATNERAAVVHLPSPAQEEFIVGRTFTPVTPKNKRMESPKLRPSSAKYSSSMVPDNDTAIGAYTQMKKALGILSTKERDRKGRPPSGRHHSSPHSGVTIPQADRDLDSGKGDHVHSPFSCPKCDKMYLKSRDLDIHLTYCAR